VAILQLHRLRQALTVYDEGISERLQVPPLWQFLARIAPSRRLPLCLTIKVFPARSDQRRLKIFGVSNIFRRLMMKPGPLLGPALAIERVKIRRVKP
jgi:hypothetical protein